MNVFLTIGALIPVYMGDPGFTREYTDDQIRRQNSMRVGESTAVENPDRDAGGQLLSEGETTIDQMLQQSAVGDSEEIEEEPDRYEFTGDGVALGSIGYTLVWKPDYDLE